MIEEQRGPGMPAPNAAPREMGPPIGQRNVRVTVAVYPPTPQKPRGYLGAGFTCVEPDPGETHLRGNDLADGPCTEETLQRIIADLRVMAGLTENDRFHQA